MFKKLLIFIFFLLTPVSAEDVHYIITGGPALRKWENLRVEANRHDKWWANFIRASTLRMVEIRKAYGKDAKVVWAVYKDGYTMRGSEDGKPLTTWISDLAKRRNVELLWFNDNKQAISTINRQKHGSIKTFDYFGHSNKYCFMFDYSSHISSACKCWFHQVDINKVNRSVFQKKCLSKSWGCFTGESMSKVWKAHTGHTLIGARGKTDYQYVGRGQMPAINGTWIR